MVDTPTTRNRFRKQALGTNTNTWGDTKLNEVEDCIDQVIDGVETINLTSSADYTLTTTNYTTADEAKNRVLVFTGTLSAAVNVIVPSVEHEYNIVNTCGQILTVKPSAGTGVAIPNNRTCRIYCDAVNVSNAAPNWISHFATSPSNNGDLIVWQVLQAALAAAVIPGANGTVKVDALAASVYLISALTEGTGIDIADLGDSLGLSVDTTELEEFLALSGKITATLASGTTAMTARRRYRISSTATGTLPTMAAGDFVIVEFTNAAGITATVGRNSQTIDGSATDDTLIGSGGNGPVVRYDYASAGVVTSRVIEGTPV